MSEGGETARRGHLSVQVARRPRPHGTSGKWSGLPDQLIEDVDLVDLAARDNHHGGNTAAKIEQRVKLDSRFVSAKLSPGKKRQA